MYNTQFPAAAYKGKGPVFVSSALCDAYASGPMLDLRPSDIPPDRTASFDSLVERVAWQLVTLARMDWEPYGPQPPSKHVVATSIEQGVAMLTHLPLDKSGIKTVSDSTLYSLSLIHET